MIWHTLQALVSEVGAYKMLEGLQGYGIPQLVTFGKDDDYVFLATQLLKGKHLGKSGAPTPTQAKVDCLCCLKLFICDCFEGYVGRKAHTSRGKLGESEKFVFRQIWRRLCVSPNSAFVVAYVGKHRSGNDSGHFLGVLHRFSYAWVSVNKKVNK